MMRDLIVRFYEQLWNTWDDSSVDDVLSADFRFRGSLGTETTGVAQWRAYRDAIRLGSADFHNEIIEFVAEGERAAARLLYSGTHTGPLLGIEATGRRFSYAGAAFFRANEERLAEAWVLGDIAGLTHILGS